MLEKNKDYLEIRVSSTDCAFTKNASTTISIEGFSYDTSFRLPDHGESYVIVSKEKFDQLQTNVKHYMDLSTRAQYWKDKCEQLQADNQHYRELANQWEENYNLLLKKTGFDTVESLIFYLTNISKCDTLLEALGILLNSAKYVSDERKDLGKKLEECEKDYISERDKAEALQTENEELKKKLHGFDPTPEFKELLKNLYSIEDVEKLEWTLNHICGGQASVNGWRASSKFWNGRYKDLLKLVGFSSKKEAEDYLVNEAECDTLHGAISKLKDQVKYTCDEWYSANSRNISWKAAAECNTPKELIEKLNLLRDDISGRNTVIESYKRDIEKWQKATGWLRPEDISAESMISKSMANEITTANEELLSENEKCEKRIEALLSEIREWKTATGCNSPEVAKCRINALINEATAWEDYYNHLLALTGFDNEGEIEDFLEQNHDRNKLTTVIDNLKLENETMKSALRASNRAMLKGLDQEIDKWQKATGRTSPEEAKQYIDRLKDRLNKIHDCSVDW